MLNKVIKLSATWCLPCKYYKDIFDKVSKKEEFKDIEFSTLDVEADDLGFEYAQKYNIQSIPTTLLLNNNGEVVERLVGLIQADELTTTISKYMSN
jgi:thiol-disulfide isomerase/thioredoxin